MLPKLNYVFHLLMFMINFSDSRNILIHIKDKNVSQLSKGGKAYSLENKNHLEGLRTIENHNRDDGEMNNSSMVEGILGKGSSMIRLRTSIKVIDCFLTQKFFKVFCEPIYLLSKCFRSICY